jgi:hypothetical protein
MQEKRLFSEVRMVTIRDELYSRYPDISLAAIRGTDQRQQKSVQSQCLLYSWSLTKQSLAFGGIAQCSCVLVCQIDYILSRAFWACAGFHLHYHPLHPVMILTVDAFVETWLLLNWSII